jgi:hypothetical protein
MLPFEFTVEGPPLSYQTRDRAKLRAWQQRVRDAASNRWSPNPPVVGALQIEVTYYHEGPVIRMDNDNLLKPIQDALNGLVYNDDQQITDTLVRKTAIDELFYIRGASLVLLEALSHDQEFLHIVIKEAPDHTVLLR